MKALAAGKHVLSEKPGAPNVKAACQLLEAYLPCSKHQVWGVSENWRFETVFVQVILPFLVHT